MSPAPHSSVEVSLESWRKNTHTLPEQPGVIPGSQHKLHSPLTQAECAMEQVLRFSRGGQGSVCSGRPTPNKAIHTSWQTDNTTSFHGTDCSAQTKIWGSPSSPPAPQNIKTCLDLFSSLPNWIPERQPVSYPSKGQILPVNWLL